VNKVHKYFPSDNVSNLSEYSQEGWRTNCLMSVHSYLNITMNSLMSKCPGTLTP